MRVPLCFILFICTIPAAGQSGGIIPPDKERPVHYQPEGNDFICTHPTLRFNRALYGTNTAFRVEAGDLPEFALYLPGMGGNFKFGLISGDSSKWLTDAQHIKATYRAGSMIYEIRDALLGPGYFTITVLALANAEGMIIKTAAIAVPASTELVWVFGGVSGKRFSRDGDIGADPESSFYLQPAYCLDNNYVIGQDNFRLSYAAGKVATEEERYEIKHLPGDQKEKSITEKSALKYMAGVFPPSSSVHIADAEKQQNPLELSRSVMSATAVITGRMPLDTGNHYFLILNSASFVPGTGKALSLLFEQAEAAREKLAGRIRINTPDPYINTLGGALSMAADAIWEAPSYLHGAVAWRMRLNAWRGRYVADPLGWHDRARMHFSSYALSQVTDPDTGPVVADTTLHLARQAEQMGTSLFSSGYICRNPNGDIRPHHYDMNLVYIDALLDHFNWTGDTGYVRQMWPVLQRHLAWEKRNFDTDGDGLYDAYAAIWASDALQYSGGGVTHSSAYNYRANAMTAELARMIGKDPTLYQTEADHIFKAIHTQLWMPGLGWYAEYKDALGLRLVHPSAGLWTIYHAIDSKLPDAFQSYQCLKYIDAFIPHIPIHAKGLADADLYLLATTNWQPYTWSLNNVALAENLHTALAYWQGGRSEEAYRLWKSALTESMYLSASPGGFEQLSFYDAVRGELYRDFADPIGMASRSLVEGLFGIEPDALHDTLSIHPGLPNAWNYTFLSVPDLSVDFRKEKDTDTYTIIPLFSKPLTLKFSVKARKDVISRILVNGKMTHWKQQDNAVGSAGIVLILPPQRLYRIRIEWTGRSFEIPLLKDMYSRREGLSLQYQVAQISAIADPQGSLQYAKHDGHILHAQINATTGTKTFFVDVEQGQFNYWQPFSFAVKEDRGLPDKPVTDSHTLFEKISLSSVFNAKVTDIFRQQYLSPRVSSATLQLPTQGIGNWCYPLTTAIINDKGSRQLAGSRNELRTPEGIPFQTPSDTLLNNIVFTSQWDNFPGAVTFPLAGSASHIYFLMAGSTDPMQSRIQNGSILVQYTDGSSDTLALRNPENWWPIEQDYIIDGHAFTTGAPVPLRLYLQEGKFAYGLDKYSTIKGFTNRAIEGGAATVLDMAVQPAKKLRSLTLQTLTNDVVIGLMSLTLRRN